ncbi:hypothetical protein [Nakamurella deserti]|uniref:hypothetical protein n=1 Tax=Nakamurella deserti TaxID=2164074 RepID=UPI000DBE3663|nr:hypothetical protein [Nakamurella deserti]
MSQPMSGPYAPGPHPSPPLGHGPGAGYGPTGAPPNSLAPPAPRPAGPSHPQHHQGSPGPSPADPAAHGSTPTAPQGSPDRQDHPQGPYEQGNPFGPPTTLWPGSAPGPRPTRGALTAGALQLAALVLVPLGAGLPFGEDFAAKALWSTTTTWAVFALLAAVVQLAPLAARLQQRAPAGAWRTGAVGVGALIAFWVLIVLPGISSGPNFVLTMGTFAAALGLWLSPGRRL